MGTDLSVHFRDLFLRSSIPTAWIDFEARVVRDANAALADLFGYDRDDIIGQRPAAILADPAAGDMLRERSLEGKSTRTIVQVQTRFGIRSCELHITGLEYEASGFAQLIDITELIEANARLAADAAALMRKTADLESVTARVAHDLRSPLTSIAGFADVLVRGGDRLSTEQRDDMLQRIANNAHAVSRMASNVVEAAHRGDEVNSDARDAATLIEQLENVFRLRFDEVGGTLECRSDVVELPVPVRLVHPIAVNLVDNAVKYRHPDRVLRVRITVEATGDAVHVVVDDNGRGFTTAPEALFERGSRGPNVADTVGTGLGLAFSREAARALGGDVTAASTADGSRFTIRLVAPEVQRMTRVGGSTHSGLRGRDLESILDALATPVVVFDLAAQRIIRVNPAAEALFGAPAGDLVGRSGGALLRSQAQAETMRVELNKCGRYAGPATVTTATGPRAVEVTATLVEGTTLVACDLHLGRRR